MKKYLVAGAVLTSSVFAANNAQIIGYFKDQVSPEVKVEVVKTEKIKELPKFELVTIKLSNGDRAQEVTMFSRGDQLFPEIIDLKSKKSMRQDLEKKAQAKKIKKIYQKEDKSNIIAIGNDPKKETMVVFTDPECPYCRKELNSIDERLKSANIKLIMTPVHGKSSLEKSYLIYKDIKSAKSDKDKIAILKKYYSPDVNITGEKVSDKDVAMIDELRKKYVSSAIKGVPFIINEKEIR